MPKLQYAKARRLALLILMRAFLNKAHLTSMGELESDVCEEVKAKTGVEVHSDDLRDDMEKHIISLDEQISNMK